MENINKNDELLMKLIHYFIINEGYNPVILHGAKDEIWLEKVDADYKIIRLVSNYIHNDEQLDFDLFKTKQITKRIKKKIFTFNMNTLSIFLNLGENVDIETNHYDKIDCLKITSEDDVKKSTFLEQIFPKLKENINFKEQGVNLFMKITEEINKKSEREAKEAESTFKDKKPIITYTLIFLNVLIYILNMFYPNLINLGANVPFLVKNGEIYRLLTCGFLHLDIFHLCFNMYALFVVGSQIENFFGRNKYLIIYFTSLLTGSLLSVLFVKTASVGASGAIFGLLGSLVYFSYHHRLYLGTALKTQIIPIILLNLGLGFLNAGVIDNGAHIGGLIGGFLITMAVGINYKVNKLDRTNGIILTIIFIAFEIFMIFFR